MRQPRKDRLYKEAKARYPHLEFYWQGNQLIVVGGIRNFQDLRTLKGETAAYYADPVFSEVNKLSISTGPDNFEAVIPKPPIRKKINKNKSQEKKPTVVSSWPLPGAAAQIPSPVESPIAQTIVEATMPQKKKIHVTNRRRKPTARSRRFKLQNPALRARRLPFKQVVPITLTKGYYDYEFKLKELVPEMLTTYEEIRLVGMSVVFLTNDVSITAGIYTAILLDQDGYGAALKSTETWFKRVSDMPGSIVHHATRGFRLTWRPTEPDSRNFIKVIDSADMIKTLARVYIIAQKAELDMSGVLLIRGHVLCRGQYYDAARLTVNMMKNLRLREIEEESDCSSRPSSSYEAI